METWGSLQIRIMLRLARGLMDGRKGPKWVTTHINAHTYQVQVHAHSRFSPVDIVQGVLVLFLKAL